MSFDKVCTIINIHNSDICFKIINKIYIFNNISLEKITKTIWMCSYTKKCNLFILENNNLYCTYIDSVYNHIYTENIGIRYDYINGLINFKDKQMFFTPTFTNFTFIMTIV